MRCTDANNTSSAGRCVIHVLTASSIGCISLFVITAGGGSRSNEYCVPVAVAVLVLVGVGVRVAVLVLVGVRVAMLVLVAVRVGVRVAAAGLGGARGSAAGRGGARGGAAGRGGARAPPLAFLILRVFILYMVFISFA